MEDREDSALPSSQRSGNTKTSGGDTRLAAASPISARRRLADAAARPDADRAPRAHGCVAQTRPRRSLTAVEVRNRFSHRRGHVEVRQRLAAVHTILLRLTATGSSFQPLEDLVVEPRLVPELEGGADFGGSSSRKASKSGKVLLQVRRQLEQQRAELVAERAGHPTEA